MGDGAGWLIWVRWMKSMTAGMLRGPSVLRRKLPQCASSAAEADDAERRAGPGRRRWRRLGEDQRQQQCDDKRVLQDGEGGVGECGDGQTALMH